MDIVRIHLKISGSDFSDVISSELTYDGAHWSGHVQGIPLGSNRTIDAEAYAADGSILFLGHSTFDLAGGEPAAIELVLHDVTPPTVLSNNAPQITAVILSAHQTGPGGSITLTAKAQDWDGDPLTYTWSATAGTFDDASTNKTHWQAPETTGDVIATINVGDGSGSVSSLSFPLAVLELGEATFDVALNYAPEIRAVYATPSQLRPGQSTQLHVDVVDPEGDALTYEWYSSCWDGYFSDSYTANPIWTIRDYTWYQTCLVRVSVTDSYGGQSFGELTLGINLPEIQGSCSDGVQNQDEIAVDCGGSCDVCAAHVCEGSRYIYGDDALRQFASENCTQLRWGDLYISDVSSIVGIEALTAIDGTLYIHQTRLTSLAGLENIRHVGGNFYVAGNSLLTSLAPAQSWPNDALHQPLYIFENPHLPTAEIRALEDAQLDPAAVCGYYCWGNAIVP